MSRTTASVDATSKLDAARRALSSGDLAGAELLCKAALAANANDGGAWALLTETALQRGRPDAAIVCANRAVALSPHDPIAHVMQAKCLYLSGDLRGASTAAKTALGVENAAPEALDAIGAMFGLLGLHPQALDLFRRAVAARSDVSQYVFNLAATERMMGMLAAAEEHCDAAIAIDRRFCLAHYLRSDLRTQTQERNHIAQMDNLLREGGLPWQSEVMLRFALGKEYEDLADDARGFEHVAAGCALQRRSIHYDVKPEIAEIDRIINTQTKSWLATQSRGVADVAPVFVVGLPRTGTTLAERIVASHGAMRSVGETGAFPVALHQATQSAANNFVEVGTRYLDNVNAVTPDASRFVDKTLKNYLYCGAIHAALPNAKIILVKRHPLDSCWAMYKAHFQGAFSFSYDQLDLAEYYLAFRRLADHWRNVLPQSAYREVAYEDIIRDQEGESRRLIAFLDLPWEDDVLRFHESAAPSATASAVQVRRPIYATSVGRWRRHAERLALLHERLARALPASELE